MGDFPTLYLLPAHRDLPWNGRGDGTLTSVVLRSASWPIRIRTKSTAKSNTSPVSDKAALDEALEEGLEGVIEFFKHLVDPKWIIEHGGLYLILGIVFAETGLFIGFFCQGILCFL